MSTAIIDSHVHLWDPARLRYSWLDDVPALNRAFLPADFQRAAGAVNVDKIVFVECGRAPEQNVAEARWVADLAKNEPRIAGIVAHASLERGAAVRTELAELKTVPLVKGVRRLLQGEADANYCLRSDFVAGVKLLPEFGFSFDLCIFHHQMPEVVKLVQQCPQVRFILDHLGKPAIKAQELDPWRNHLRALAALPNVWCKISGLVTEADHQHWTREHLKPYIDHALECFGFGRVMFGGDWPVAMLATEYPRWVETLEWAVAGASEADCRRLFHDNAIVCYGLT